MGGPWRAEVSGWGKQNRESVDGGVQTELRFALKSSKMNGMCWRPLGVVSQCKWFWRNDGCFIAIR